MIYYNGSLLFSVKERQRFIFITNFSDQKFFVEGLVALSDFRYYISWLEHLAVNYANVYALHSPEGRG